MQPTRIHTRIEFRRACLLGARATNALTSTGRLAPYIAKRSFKDAPEPAPGERKEARGPLLFVIQQHSARHVHFDFRLDLDGVLKSWAIPKGLAIAPGEHAVNSNRGMSLNDRF
ncbi:MAG: DNA polymerase ligase N-terminal domain-containing protein [Gammaproteobacteria bacterium]